MTVYLDPDAAPGTRAGWRAGGWLHQAARVAALPLLGGGGVALLAGEAAVAGGVVAVGASAAGGGWVLRRVVPPARIRAREVAWPGTVPAGAPPGVGRLTGSQQGLALRLRRADEAVRRATAQDEGLGDVEVTARRVAFLAARSLLDAHRRLTRLTRRRRADVDRGAAAIRADHAAAAEAIEQLESLVAALGSQGAGSRADRLRREAASRRLAEVTEWVRARQQALAELDRAAPPRADEAPT